jgi:hypothetical protein
MKKISLLLFLVYIITIPFVINVNKAYAEHGTDYYGLILKEMNGEVVEYGLKTVFIADTNGETECEKLIYALKIDFDNNINFQYSEDDSEYSIDFNSLDFSGYIQYDKAEKNITIYMLEHKSNLDFQKIENIIKKTERKNEIDFYQYAKVKLPDNDQGKIKDKLINLLKKQCAKNIQETNLGKSVCITALTGNYKAVKAGDSIIDLNCAVCNYNSGNYLIIGTPIIYESY